MALINNNKDKTFDALFCNILGISPEDVYLPYSLNTGGFSHRAPTHIVSLMHMHAQRSTRPHRHILDRALTTHPLCGTQQGGHVLESEGATSLQQFRPSLLWTWFVCIHTVWNAAFHGSLGPLMCPFMVHMLDLSGCLFPPLPSVWSGMRSSLFLAMAD